MWNQIKKYQKRFSAKKLLAQLPKFVKSLGLKTVYTVLLLWNAYSRDETPTWAKNVILGALGYLVSPIDGIPDVTPFLGMTDDIGILSFGLVNIACYINKEIRDKSKDQLKSWFGNFEESDLSEIDAKL